MEIGPEKPTLQTWGLLRRVTGMERTAGTCRISQRTSLPSMKLAGSDQVRYRTAV